jgi:hypothetical protein
MMSQVFSLRKTVSELRLELESAKADAGSREVGLQRLRKQVEDGTFVPPHGHTAQDWLEIKDEEQSERWAHVGGFTDAVGEAMQEIGRLLDKQKPLFGEGNSEPIALLPVRIETSFADDSTIQARVYPDDVHIDSFDPRLTKAELQAGRRYWKRTGEASWQELLANLSPSRAAWVARATREGAPKPTLREEGEMRDPRVTTLPARWRFLGLVDGEVVVDERGEEIPEPLPLGVVANPSAAAESEHAKWLFDFPAAEKAGMAITLKLPEGVDHLDELYVVGVQQSAAADAAQRLRDTLFGHFFGSGLGFLAPGTPTNNTPASRSGWSSRPQPRPPGAQPPQLEPGTDAARLQSALGLPKATFLADCPGGGDTTEQGLAALTLLSWGAFGQGMVDGAHGSDLISEENLPFDPKPWRGVRDHLARYVRGRGPLPTIRVGNQPYGMLPATSLDEWGADSPGGPTAWIADWLLRLRHHWRAALAPGWIPRVTDGVAADRTAVEVLRRLPVATDLGVRRLLSPRAAKLKLGPESSGPVLAVGEIAPGANLRWTVPTELVSNLSYNGSESPPDYSLVAPRLDPEPGNYSEVFTASRELWADALAAVEGRIKPAEYERRWPLPLSTRDAEPPPRRDTIAAIVSEGQHPGLVPAMLDPANWSAWGEGSLDEDRLQAALDLPGAVDGWVTLVLDPALGDEELREDMLKNAREKAKVAPMVIEALTALEATPPERLLPLAFEVMDVHSHRLDAWITSLATRRLFDQREGKEAGGIRIGGYGWVENLRPALGGADVDGYIHAPSLQHAATAAVLRSGFRAHHGEETLAVNLTSRRARVARWLLGGVRRGQDLGSLLGYRFERALHDAGLDELIDDFRARYPAPVSAEPPEGQVDGELWKRSSEAIAARNVVDGLALARDAGTATEAFPGEAAPIIADAAAALDAVSDLLLAESVHHLVGGNPMRAGISADNLGRGEDVPDRFDVIGTPNRGRALTHRIAAVMPANPSSPAGWTADALAALEPRVEAWAADALGAAAGRRVTGAVETADGGRQDFDHGADELGFGALTTALEVAGADHAMLDARVRALTGVADGAAVEYGGEGWRQLHGAAARVRTLLSAARPLLPSHLAAPGVAEAIVPDMAELRDRLAAFVADLDPPPVPTAEPDVPKDPRERLAELVKQEDGELDETWLSEVNAMFAEVFGTSLPLLPLLGGADLGPEPKGADGGALDDWIRRAGQVRPQARTWHELLLLTGATSGRPCPLQVSQAPSAPGEAWIGGGFPATKRPMARQHTVIHLPSSAAGGQLAGIVFDEWIEVLPGSDALAETKLEGEDPVPPESELTGLSFHFDRPDSKAPQAILIAVPPNSKRGWTGDGLALAVRDTLELAKLRAVDLGDLPMLDDVLPGLRLNNMSPLGALAREYWIELAE